MPMTEAASSTTDTTQSSIEAGLELAPRFDSGGLLPAIVTDASNGGVLMFAQMNAEALQLTLNTGEVHFWSRSRGSLWRKGETSGNRLRVKTIRVDCDQDVLWIEAVLDGDAACHTGRRSCFYRRIVQDEAGAAILRMDGD